MRGKNKETWKCPVCHEKFTKPFRILVWLHKMNHPKVFSKGRVIR